MRYGNVELHNVCDIIEGDGKPGFGVTRLPRAVLEKINPGAAGKLLMTTGCEIRGMLADGGRAKVVLQAVDSNVVPPIASVYYGCFRGQSLLVGKEPTDVVISVPPNIAAMSAIRVSRKLPFDSRLVRVRLPAIHTVRIISVEGDMTYPAPGAAPAKTLLCYGSSITHGAHAIPPEGTFAAHCARRLGYDLVNLGVGGSAQMDAAVAEHIAARTDWDVAAFEMGINVRGWPLEKFQAAVQHFVGTVAQAHPDKFVFCIDLFTNNWDFDDNRARCAGFRDAVRDVAGGFKSGKVVHVDGRNILTDPTGLTIDLVHPGDLGMQEMGANLASVIARYMQEPKA